MPASGAVTRSTLRQQIADALRDEVLAGRLLPGQEFTVKQIAEQYGVSATPVREALVDLSAQDLLDSDQHRGFRVHQFSLADFRGMVEARALVVDAVFRELEGEHLAARAQSTALVSVRRRAEEATRAARSGDLNILIGYDLRFWRELGALVANRYVAEFLHRLRVQAWVFSVPYLREETADGKWLWHGHERLVDAFTLGDVSLVRTVIREYDDHSRAWAERLETPGSSRR
ncbi:MULTISPECIES: GntR family transcriptional regulator [unclassified Streptomyces]|uniref:GntR family transcriptional regulator n=1 Tax=unclassified Streptomyces TaxID=2593676 RepID=UPI0004C73B84|nr:GntR family transcriptional regulator [Streptomyces sp. NRRL F-5135]